MSRILLLLMLITGMLSGAWAQGSLASYRLKPEDVISIRVFGEREMDVDAPVGFDGKISVPLLGFIQAAGKTVSDLEMFIKSELIRQQFYRDPKVSVNIVRFKDLKASVVGIAQRPGQFDFKPGDRLLSLIAQAGGPLPNVSDLKRATLVRRGSIEQIPIDLQAMLEKGDLSQNYELQDGDVLNIPEVKVRFVNVIGFVNQPQRIEWRPSMTLADAIAQAGGEVQYRGSLSKVQVQRMVAGRANEYRRMEVDFTKFVKKNDFTQNPELLAGDIVYVPSSNNVDLNRASAIANIVFTVQSLLQRNFNFRPF